MAFKRSDLRHQYSWAVIPGDDPKITGKPDSTLFSRKEGYEVLYMINKVLKKRNLASVTSGQKAENLIQNKLPGTTRSQANVFDFINSEW